MNKDPPNKDSIETKRQDNNQLNMASIFASLPLLKQTINYQLKQKQIWKNKKENRSDK